MEKKCSKCLLIFDIDNFHKTSKLNKSGNIIYNAWCKDCKRTWNRINAAEKRADIKANRTTPKRAYKPRTTGTRGSYNKTGEVPIKTIKRNKVLERYGDSKFYLTNIELTKEIIVSQALGKLTRRASEMLYLIGKNMIRKFTYKNPDDRFDCLQEAMYQLYKNWMSFDLDMGNNAFSYYSEIAKRGLAKAFNDLHVKRSGEYMSNITMSLSGWGDDGKSEINI